MNYGRAWFSLNGCTQVFTSVNILNCKSSALKWCGVGKLGIYGGQGCSFVLATIRGFFQIYTWNKIKHISNVHNSLNENEHLYIHVLAF